MTSENHTLSVDAADIRFLPINIRIDDAEILIVGGGKVASHKAEILSRFTSRVTVVAPRISDRIKSLPFRTIERTFSSPDLQGKKLLFICTENHALNRKIKNLAASQGILASVCDAPDLCDFTSPAIYKKDHLTISVASDARDVKRSIRVRNEIEKAAKHDYIHLD